MCHPTPITDHSHQKSLLAAASFTTTTTTTMATLTKLVVVFATLMAMTGKSFFPIVEGLEEWANDILLSAKKSNPSSLVATNNTFSWCHGTESTIHEGNVILWFSLPTAMQSKGSLVPSLLPQNDKNLLFAITFLSHYPITHHPHVFISLSQKTKMPTLPLFQNHPCIPSRRRRLLLRCR